jgi:hypothetical protein
VCGDVTGQTVFTFANLKVYKSTTYAASWSPLGTSGLPATSFNIRNFGVSMGNINRMGLVANGGRVYLSSNAGASWTATTTPPNNGLSLSSIWFDDATSAVYVTSVAPDATKTHVWKTTDDGLTWTAIDGGGFPAGIPVNAVIKAGTSLYAATHLGVYMSTDDGASWTRWGSGMPLVNVFDLNFANGTLVRGATYGRGVWEIVP